MRVIGNKMYDVCASCGKIVCLNKPLLGGLHICAPKNIRGSKSIAIKAKRNSDILHGDKNII
jgi:hypothetical protein